MLMTAMTPTYQVSPVQMSQTNPRFQMLTGCKTCRGVGPQAAEETQLLNRIFIVGFEDVRSVLQTVRSLLHTAPLVVSLLLLCIPLGGGEVLDDINFDRLMCRGEIFGAFIRYLRNPVGTLTFFFYHTLSYQCKILLLFTKRLFQKEYLFYFLTWNLLTTRLMQ